MKNLLRNHISIIVLISISTFIFSWDSKYEGGDIAAARRSYLGENPIDLWGAYSGFFYGNLPNTLFPWGLWLLLIQILATSIGLIFILSSIALNTKYEFVFFFILVYVSLTFTGYLTRDSTLTSLYIFGIGLIFRSVKITNSLNHLFFYTGILLILMAMAFRPWLGLAAIFSIIYLLKSKLRFISVTITLIAVPFSLDQLSYLSKDFNHVHPEFQVIISDLASMTCLSTNQITKEQGLIILNEFGNTSNSLSEICTDYRINTWQSVGGWSVKPSELGSIPGLDRVESTSKILISSDLAVYKVDQIRKSWIKFIIENPKDYLQVKLIHATQIGFAGDTWGLRILSAENLMDYIAGVFFAPFDLLISFHLLSPIMTLLFGFLIICIKLKKCTLISILKNRDILFAFMFLLTWWFLSTIAYIGDNGRYTYFSSFIFYILILRGTSAIKNSCQVES